MIARIPKHPPLPDLPVVGQSYQRPCVRGVWRSVEPRWLPVIGPVHTDTGPVNADFEHVHVDYRFLPRAMRAEADAGPHSIFNINAVHSTPISTVWPEGADSPISLDDGDIRDWPDQSWMRLDELAYQGPYPQYPGQFVPWLRDLHGFYRDATLKGGICPHQGADLRGIEPDAQGIITCPLHGLRWRADNGRIAAPPVPRQPYLPI